MRIAIPYFENQVSPRFDCTQHVLIVDTVNGETANRSQLDFIGVSPRQRVERLAAEGVDFVICGGLDTYCASHLEMHGIPVCAWVTGSVDDALASFLQGTLEPRMMLGVRGRCRGRWRVHPEPARPWWMTHEEQQQPTETEDFGMPRGDGTGPAGQGPGTGRGRGPCGGGQGKGQRPGRGQGQGQGQLPLLKIPPEGRTASGILQRKSPRAD